MDHGRDRTAPFFEIREQFSPNFVIAQCNDPPKLRDHGGIVGKIEPAEHGDVVYALPAGFRVVEKSGDFQAQCLAVVRRNAPLATGAHDDNAPALLQATQGTGSFKIGLILILFDAKVAGLVGGEAALH